MVISFNDVSFSYGERDIIKNATFNINEGDRIGIIGVNGAGKSTLLKMITGEIDDFNGSISIKNNVSVSYLTQNFIYNENDTIYIKAKEVFSYLDDVKKELDMLSKNTDNEENNNRYNQLLNFFEQQDGYNVDYKIDFVLSSMGFNKETYNKKINTLSGGEKTRLSLSLLMLKNPDVLVLDEPTNHLDFSMLIWLEKFLVSYKGTIILVSHDRYFLDKVVNMIYEVENQQIISYKGNYSKYIKLKEEKIKRQTILYDEQQKELSKLSEYVEKNLARASTSKMAQSRRKAMEKMERIQKPQVYMKKSAIQFNSSINPYKDVLKVENMSISVPSGLEDKVLLKNITFNIERGDKVAIVGDNGCGKTTFLRTLVGLHKNSCGKFTFGKNTLLSYFDQEQKSLDHTLTVYEQVRKEFGGLTDLEIRNVLARLLFTNDDIYKKISMLSGGEKSKLAFCILMLQTTNTLILDEPTNHLDVFTREVLDNALNNYSGTLLFVSHDRYLLSNVCNKIIEFSKENGSTIFNGFDDYMSYLTKKINSSTNYANKNSNDSTVQKNNSGNYKSKEDKKKRALKRQRISELLKSIDYLEIKISDLEAKIQCEDVYNDFKLLEENTLLIHSLKEQLERDTEEYFLLEEE